MKTYGSEDILTALKDVGMKKGDTVLLHSSVMSLGRFSGVKTSDIPKKTVSVIHRYLGGDGTLVAPAFNYDFTKGKPFDRQGTSSDGMGVIAETIRTWPGAERSTHPLESITAIGKLAVEICEQDTPSSYGIGGPFHKMFEVNAKLLLYGVSMQPASFIHYAEERCEVPYRYWKAFKGLYIDRGKSEKKGYRMFVRDLELNPRLKLSILEKEMKTKGNIKQSRLGMGQISAFTFSDFHKTATSMLGKDPLCLLENRREVYLKLKMRKKV